MSRSKKNKGKSSRISKFFRKKILKSHETNVDENQNARKKESDKFDPAGQITDSITSKKQKKRFFHVRRPKQKNKACSVSVVLSSSEAIISPPDMIEVADDTKSLTSKTNNKTLEESADNEEISNSICVSPKHENQIIQYDAATVGRLPLRKNRISADCHNLRNTGSFSSTLSRQKLPHKRENRNQRDVNDAASTAYSQLCSQSNHCLKNDPSGYRDSFQPWHSTGDVRHTLRPVIRSPSSCHPWNESCWVASENEKILKTKSMVDLSEGDATISNSKIWSKTVPKIIGRKIINGGNACTHDELIYGDKERTMVRKKCHYYSGQNPCVKDDNFSCTNVISPSSFLYNFTGDTSLGFPSCTSVQIHDASINPTKSFDTYSVGFSGARRNVDLREQQTVCHVKQDNITSKRDCDTLPRQHGSIGLATSFHSNVANLGLQIDDKKVSRSRSRARNIAKRFGGSAENLRANSLTLYKANNWGAGFEPPEGYCKMKPLLRAVDQSESTICVKNERGRKSRQPNSAHASLSRQKNDIHDAAEDHAIPAVGDTFYYGRRPLSATFLEYHPVHQVVTQTTQASSERHKRTGRVERPKVFYELDV